MQTYMHDRSIKPRKHNAVQNKLERIHKKPGGKEHADGQQDDGEVGEHSRVHRAGISGHRLELLQLK